jgi:hypothetical protein
VAFIPVIGQPKGRPEFEERPDTSGLRLAVLDELEDSMKDVSATRREELIEEIAATRFERESDDALLWAETTEHWRDVYRSASAPDADAVLSLFARWETETAKPVGYVVVDKSTNALDWDGEIHADIESATASVDGDTPYNDPDWKPWETYEIMTVNRLGVVS